MTWRLIRLSENFVYDVLAHFSVHDVVALNIYHVIARSAYGLMAQILGGLITYLLLAIYCHEQHSERVSISRVRELRIKIRNELAEMLAEEIGNNREECETDLQPTGPPSYASP